MLLVFSSTLSKKSHQLRLFIEEIDKRGIPHIIIDVHDMATEAKFSIQNNGGNIFLFEEGKKIISPQKIYVMNVWRTDSIIRLPKEVDKPQLVRNKINQFVNDIRFAFEDCYWIPGRIEDIERADSKIRLFKEAKSCGICVPNLTVNSLKHNGSFPVYKKNLGYPFSISYSRRKSEEIAIITTNTLVKDSKDITLDDGLLWQWQTPILSSLQIRCQVIGNKVWSIAWNRTDYAEDYRYVNEIKKRNVNWRLYNLPEKISSQVLELMKKLSLDMASPEFLVNENGEYVLIDFNPCGDWFGFFPEIQRKEILKSLIDLII